MHKNICFVATILIVAIIAFGCSSGSSPTAPILRDNLAPRDSSGIGQTGLVGLWQVAIDLNSKTIEAVPARTSDLILNVLGFMEPPALDKMTIDFDTLVIDSENTTVEVDVIFTHPLVTPDNAFQGFDVRGIVFGPTVTNADGYTAVMNPADFADVPFGYFDGLLGAPNSYANYDAPYWPYKYFCDDIYPTEEVWDFFYNNTDIAAHRGKFSEGESTTRHYNLSWEGLTTPMDFLVFNYAVYANFDWAVGDPPHTDDSFPVTTANSAEAFCMSYEAVNNNLNYFEDAGWGEISLDIRVWDWQGLDSTEVTIESIDAGVIVPVTEGTFGPGSDPFDGIVSFVDVPGTPEGLDDIDILVTVTDNSMTYGAAWFFELLPTDHLYYDLPVANYWIISVSVGEESPCATSEPVDIEDAPYYGTWIDDLTEDTMCAYEISNVGGTDMIWVWDEVTTEFKCQVEIAPYDDDVNALLVGPEILVPSTGGMNMTWNFTAVIDAADPTADGTRIGFIKNGEPLVTILNQTASVTAYDMGFNLGGQTQGDIIQPCIYFTSDDVLNNGTGVVLHSVTTTVFDPGPMPDITLDGTPDSANEICSTGTEVLWGTMGVWPGVYYRYAGPPYTFSYPAGFSWTWGGTTASALLMGDCAWVFPTGTVSSYAHRPCAMTLGTDRLVVFGDMMASITGGAVTPQCPTGLPDRAGALLYQGLNINTATERMVIQWCDIGQMYESPASTANFRMVINGDDNSDADTVYFEYLDVGTHDDETQPETDTGSYIVFNGIYLEVFCDGENWANNVRYKIDQP